MNRLVLAAAGLLMSAGFVAGGVSGTANAGPGSCSWESPYPSNPYNKCVLQPGVECAVWRCASPPGTQGKWDVTGWYTPCTRSGGCGTKLDE